MVLGLIAETQGSSSHTIFICCRDSLYCCLMAKPLLSVSSSPLSSRLSCSFLSHTPSIIVLIKISKSLYSQSMRISLKCFTKLSNDSPLFCFRSLNLCLAIRLFFLGRMYFSNFLRNLSDFIEISHRWIVFDIDFLAELLTPCKINTSRPLWLLFFWGQPLTVTYITLSKDSGHSRMPCAILGTGMLLTKPYLGYLGPY